MSYLFLALILYPEVQKRARAELDSVVSRDRLPTFDDRPRLPYIEAVCKELLRWGVVIPMCTSSFSMVWITRSDFTSGAPHASSEDDIYGGFFIPKGLMNS